MENPYTRHAVPETAGAAIRSQRKAMNLSLGTGVLMLAGKWAAYSLTGSAAILSDAAESVVHVAAVAFAAFSLWLSMRPADEDHHFGHEKIGFFSAGFEGAMIVLAAVYILYAAIEKWLSGLRLENLGLGTVLVAGAAAVNAALGYYLLWQGKKYGSLILEADGRHVLTDVWTSLGVIVGLSLTILTGWLPFDPILAIFVALNILWSGAKLMRRSIAGLMDESDPALNARLRDLLKALMHPPLVGFHDLRHRNLGSKLSVEVHLLFAPGTSLERAHELATEVEDSIGEMLQSPALVTTHLEPADRHDEHHPLKRNAEGGMQKAE